MNKTLLAILIAIVAAMFPLLLFGHLVGLGPLGYMIGPSFYHGIRGYTLPHAFGYGGMRFSWSGILSLWFIWLSIGFAQLALLGGLVMWLLRQNGSKLQQG